MSLVEVVKSCAASREFVASFSKASGFAVVAPIGAIVDRAKSQAVARENLQEEGLMVASFIVFVQREVWARHLRRLEKTTELEARAVANTEANPDGAAE